jgi:hypothetical protein
MCGVCVEGDRMEDVMMGEVVMWSLRGEKF